MSASPGDLPPLRVTHALVAVALALLDKPTAPHWGYELCNEAGVRSGALYPMLSRMLERGWLTDGWEDPTTIKEKRPPRRYYQLTDRGREELGRILQGARTDPRFRQLKARLSW